MADATPAADPKVAAVTQDVMDAITEIKADIAAYKSGGVSAAMQHLPAIIAAATKDVADVTAVIPVIKAGYQTTEFWFATLSCVLIAALAKFTSLSPSSLVAVSSAIAALAAVYTVVRGMIKSSAPAPTPVAAAK